MQLLPILAIVKVLAALRARRGEARRGGGGTSIDYGTEANDDDKEDDYDYGFGGCYLKS